MKSIWFKLFHAPFIIFLYKDEEKQVYENTKGALERTLSKNTFYLEFDDNKLEIKVWRLDRK